MKKRGLIFSCICLLLLALFPAFLQGAGAEESPELVINGGFEELDASGAPANWYTSMYQQQEGYSWVRVSTDKARSGEHSALVRNSSANDARFICNVAVEPESMYRFSAYVLVERMEETGNGANLAIEEIYAYSEPVFDTQGEWKYVEWYGETGPQQRTVALGVRVGGYGAESVGSAYFDDVSLVKVDELPQDVIASVWYREKAPDAQAVPYVTTAEKSTVLYVVLAALFILLALLSDQYLLNDRRASLQGKEISENIWLLVFGGIWMAALAARIILARSITGYQVDINCFTAWSQRMAELGPVDFYADGYFCDYPPGYMLLLWPIGLLLKAGGGEALLLIKTIPLICDMGIALFLFLFIHKRINARVAVCVSLLFLLNPAALVNGAAWGQVDSLLALIVLITAYYAMAQKWSAALPLFIIGVLVKPQALLLAPVGGIWMIASVLRSKARKEQLRSILFGVIWAVAAAAAIILPFAVKQEKPLMWLYDLYKDTLSSYGYATVNAANLYYLLGANWKDLTETAPRLVFFITGGLLAIFGSWWMWLKQEGSAGWRTLASLSKELGQGGIASERTVQSLLATLSLLASTAFFIAGLAGNDYQNYGILMMIFVFAWTLLGALRDTDLRAMPFYLALGLIGVYVLGIKIHERYLFAALPLLLMGYGTTKDKRLLVLFVGFSATTFLNTAIILDNSILFGAVRGHLNDDTLWLNRAISIINLALCGYAGFISFFGIRETVSRVRENESSEEVPKRTHTYEQALLTPKDARLALGWKDWLIMGAVTAAYALLAFFNLGSTVAPQNNWVASSSEEKIVFELKTDSPYYLLYYGGVHRYNFSISTSADGLNWEETYPCEMQQGLCFRWKYATHLRDGETDKFLDDSPANRVLLEGRYLRLNAEAPGLNLMEIIARNEAGEQIPMKILAHTGWAEEAVDELRPPENLLDEQDTLEGEPGWFNGTYFDEIYHARTAYEHLHGQYPYETTHPPLGKLLMAACVAIFGMTPFGWRFAGTLTGVLMLPALYLLAKQIFRRRDLAAFSMLAFSLDLMHFAQTRIATIDSFPVLFIILSYLCMARYLMMDVFAVKPGEKKRLFSSAFLRSLIPLALCGLFMGLSIASKWIGMYSAVGLALLFFTAIYRQLRVGNLSYDYGASAGETTEEALEVRIAGAQEYTLRRIAITCGACLVFFVAVPLVIYYLSYIPHLRPNGPVTIARVIAAQESMLNYHATPGLGSDHPFQSPWWQWPLILKPMWYVQDKFEPAGFSSTIMCLGNPLVFYVGAVCMLIALGAYVHKYVSLRRGLSFKQGDGNMLLPVLTIGFLAQYLPWVLVPRSTYIYHYFASVPFIIMATAWAFDFAPESKKRLRYGIMALYLVLAAAFFVAFFPYASGALTPNSWFAAMKWFPGLLY